MNSFSIYTHSPASAGSRHLRDTLNVPMYSRRRNPPPAGMGSDRVVLNWGVANPPSSLDNVTWINEPDGVEMASSKLATLCHLRANGVDVPTFTTSEGVAAQISRASETLLARTKDRGSAGSGIHIVRPGDPIETAYDGLSVKFWSVYQVPLREYRIHIVNETRGVFIQQKKKRRDGVDNDYVRSYNNGWVFTINDVESPQAATINAARRTIELLRLDFGAVDLIEYLELDGSIGCKILEVNTAPGMQGDTTKAFYIDQIGTLFRRLRDDDAVPVEEAPPAMVPTNTAPQPTEIPPEVVQPAAPRFTFQIIGEEYDSHDDDDAIECGGLSAVVRHTVVISNATGRTVMQFRFMSQTLFGQCGMTYLCDFSGASGAYTLSRSERQELLRSGILSDAFDYIQEGYAEPSPMSYYYRGNPLAKLVCTTSSMQTGVSQVLLKAGFEQHGQGVLNTNSGEMVFLWSRDRKDVDKVQHART